MGIRLSQFSGRSFHHIDPRITLPAFLQHGHAAKRAVHSATAGHIESPVLNVQHLSPLNNLSFCMPTASPVDSLHLENQKVAFLVYIEAVLFDLLQFNRKQVVINGLVSRDVQLDFSGSGTCHVFQ